MFYLLFKALFGFLQSFVLKRKLFSLGLLGVLSIVLCVLLWANQGAPTAIPPEVWKELSGDSQKLVGDLRESASGIQVLQKMFDYAAAVSKVKNGQVIDVTPPTYRKINGIDYLASAITTLSEGAKRREWYVLNLKSQQYYSLSPEEYDTFLASGNLAKDGSPFVNVLLVYGAVNAGTGNAGQANSPQVAAEAARQETPSPAVTPNAGNASPNPEGNYDLFFTVDGVKERVCTSDGHLTPKFKTADGALPLVRQVFRALAPAAYVNPAHATILGELTGADDRFRGFKEATSDNGARKWILAELEANISFEKPDYRYGNSQGEANTEQDVAIVIELNPINIYILNSYEFSYFMSKGDVRQHSAGVLWQSVQR